MRTIRISRIARIGRIGRRPNNLVILIAALAVLPFAAARPSPPPPAPVRVAAPVPATGAILGLLQFNMCGNACGTHQTVVGDLENSITQHNPEPFVVTLNEVCRGQFGKLLADLPYFGHFEPTIPHRCWDGSDYGIAILLHTSDVGYLGSWPLPNPFHGEPRTMSCLRTTVPGASRPLTACVSHLDNEPPNSPSQVAQVASVAGSFWPATDVVVGGDFNSTPANPALNAMYSQAYPGGRGVFDEADSADFLRTGGGVGTTFNEFTGGCATFPCGRRPGLHHPNGKIDYWWLSRDDFTSYSAHGADVAHSDHVQLWATAVIH